MKADNFFWVSSTSPVRYCSCSCLYSIYCKNKGHEGVMESIVHRVWTAGGLHKGAEASWRSAKVWKVAKGCSPYTFLDKGKLIVGHDEVVYSAGRWQSMSKHHVIQVTLYCSHYWTWYFFLLSTCTSSYTMLDIHTLPQHKNSCFQPLTVPNIQYNYP